MAVNELFGITLGAKSAEVRYLITGESTPAAARTAMLAAAASTYNGINKNAAASSVTETDEAQSYEGRVVYGSSGGGTEELQSGDTAIQFDITSEQTQISQSLSTVDTEYEDTVYDFGGLIGATQSGEYKGTTILTPAVNFTITKVVASSSVTSSFINGVVAVKNAPVNSSTFSHTDTAGRSVSLAAGECLFVGMSSASKGGDLDELVFTFAASANLTGVVVGALPGVDKKGWEHIWTYYAEQEDATNDTLVQKPAAVYVEKIYETGSFAGLGL